jgi:hypothetical protein
MLIPRASLEPELMAAWSSSVGKTASSFIRRTGRRAGSLFGVLAAALCLNDSARPLARLPTHSPARLPVTSAREPLTLAGSAPGRWLRDSERTVQRQEGSHDEVGEQLITAAQAVRPWAAALTPRGINVPSNTKASL